MLKALIPLAISAALSTSVAAQETSFNHAYQKYKDAVESGQPAGQYAKAAYALGVEKFGKDSVNVANLAINYAGTLGVHSKELREQRSELYQRALSIFANDKETSELAKIDPLFGLAESADGRIDTTDYLEQAIEVASKSKDFKLLADLRVNAAQVLIRRFHFKPHAMTQAREYLDKAESYYQSHVANNTLEYVRINLYQAIVHGARGNKNESIERLTNVIKVFDDNLEFDHLLELQARSMLVELYEQKGDRDSATEHSLAIAKMRPWSDDAEQVPIYRVHPKYPISAARWGKEGWVEMQITIDPAGLVEQVTVLDSDGGSKFEREARKAVEQWRYAPKFENGQPVAATTKVRLDFKLGS
ncbi:energy transducer TonB [Pseudoalteromonas sp. T1lg75]|uniref:energy transducer TonB n=1 Tax=Pseudoalteromonas sp. T1lg75 TaxID=2077102 RepID=UPI000CF5DBF4|nr:energy transducer TonB [Pseudoalteromonas sp. T1lg75]